MPGNTATHTSMGQHPVTMRSPLYRCMLISITGRHML
jgi:hypothetical protein